MADDAISPNLRGIQPFTFAPRRVEKPWGYELIWAETEEYVGKILFVRAGHSLSLQFHNVKDEAWYVHSGRAELDLAEPGVKILESEVVGPGEAFRIRPGTVHRIRALEDTTVFEVSTPHLQDIVRLEDAYGREGTNQP